MDLSVSTVEMPAQRSVESTTKERHILGVRFFDGSAACAVDKVLGGGLLVAPAAPSFIELTKSGEYRQALLDSDAVIADSAFMVLIWNLLQRDNLRRVSGLAYLRELLMRPTVRQPGRTLWIMASPESAARNLGWLQDQGIEVPPDCVYLAPMYGTVIQADELLDHIRTLRPAHIIITIGGGTQERLGLLVKKNLDYLPGIHCIGAAIAFLSGDQVRIPEWADRLYLGWLFRCISDPARYGRRYWSALPLARILYRYRSELPPLENAS